MRLRFLAFLLAVIAGVLLAVPAVQAQPFPETTYQEMQWRMIGPFRGGRTRAVAGVPGEPNKFYIGEVDGGVWESDDYGRTWKPIFDHQDTQSIGAIAVAPSNPEVIYVASGEGLQRPDLSVGDGIYRSDDGGRTWTHLGLRDSQQIPALAIDPHDPNRLFAAVLGHPYGPNPQRGIFRSTDGGKTWEKVLYKDDNTGAYDVDIDPSNPQIVYASLWEGRQGPWEYNNAYGGEEGGIYKSTDGGTTWHQLTKGLPDHIVQANLAIAPSEPSRIYAILATALRSPYQSDKDMGLYRSDDGGASWHSVTDDARPLMRIGGGDLPMPAVDPKNPDVVYSTAIVTVRSVDGGKTWKSIRGAPGGDDYQNLWINPNNPKIILLASDQGAVVTVNGGRTWSSWYNQPTAQLYHVQANNSFPYKVCSGQQDSGSVCISSRGNDGEVTYRDWHPVGTIEYGYVAPDPLNADIFYGAGRNQVTRYQWSTGQTQNVTPIPVLGSKYRVDRTQPLIFSPVDPHRLYYAANMVFATDDGGHTWKTISPDLGREHPGIPPSLGTLAAKDPKAEKQRGVVYALGPSFRDVDTLWAGTDDGSIWVTHDGGKHWKNVTPPGLAPWSKVTQIIAGHDDDHSAYASVSRFRVNDLKPYIYRTHDDGSTWQLITNGLPDNAPVDTVREDPVRSGLLFAGTERGVWVSFDDGDHWQSLQLNLPHTSMRDLWIHDNDLIVATHGRSFWILDDITPLRQISQKVLDGGSFLFKPAAAYRVRRDTYSDTPPPPGEPAGENPPTGAIIDYYLTRPESGPVALEILDASGNVVRRYASTDIPDVRQAELDKQLIPLYWIRPARILPATEGMHRWVWDLRYPPPRSTRHGYPISAVPHDTPLYPLGPLVLPGDYTVRLSVAGKSLDRPLTVLMDPRVKTPRAGLERQFELEMRLAKMMGESSRAVSEARAIREQLEVASHKARGRLVRHIDALTKSVGELLDGSRSSGSSAAPSSGLDQLDGEVGSLYGEVGQADVTPTVAQEAAVNNVVSALPPVLQRWREIETHDLPRLNRRLKRAGLSEIHAGPVPMKVGGSYGQE